jgi:Flp pilus assembly pilin Flp
LKTFQKPVSRKRGAALVEYGLIVAGVALVAVVGITIFGKKTSDLIGTAAAILPGAHAQDNGAIVSGRLIETTNDGTDVVLDVNTIINTNSGTERLNNNLGFDNTDLVTDPTIGD